jgi:NADPH:quinone reductase-like Zn-dependent oxidoreductase
MMLKNYENLVHGDYVLQNSANSGVGRAVIEIAKGKTIVFNSPKPTYMDVNTIIFQLGA